MKEKLKKMLGGTLGGILYILYILYDLALICLGFGAFQYYSGIKNLIVQVIAVLFISAIPPLKLALNVASAMFLHDYIGWSWLASIAVVFPLMIIGVTLWGGDAAWKAIKSVINSARDY